MEDRTLTERATHTPTQIAADLFGADRADANAKRIRNYLRTNYTRPIEAKNSSWTLDADVAREVFDAFAANVTTKVVTTADANESE